MYVRRVLAAGFVVALVTAALPVFAQRNNDKQKQQTARSPQEQQDVQALVQAVDSALMADTGFKCLAPLHPQLSHRLHPLCRRPNPLSLGSPDRSQGDIPVKWELNHFVKGQTDTYIPFTVNVDRASVTGGAAVYIRIVTAEQADAFAQTMAKMAAAAAKGEKQTATRPTFAWDSISFADVAEDGRISRAVQLRPASTRCSSR